MARLGTEVFLSLSFGFCCAAFLTPSAWVQQIPDLTVDGHTVQIHAFASQGFAGTDENNYLTMKTRSGSFAMTDFAINASTSITDKLRIGAQMYDYNVGNLGNWQPTLDWGYVDYKFKDWFGIRAGVQLLGAAQNAFNQVSSGITSGGAVVTQIASSSQEQALGVGQVSTSITRISKVTQSNVANTNRTAQSAATMKE